MEFYRLKKNEFGEPCEPELFCTYNGLYHEHAAHMLDTFRYLTTDVPNRYRTEKTPQLIVPYEDFYFKKDNVSDTDEYVGVEIGDEVNFNGRLLRVTGVVNVQEWNMLMDISFEEVDTGGNTGKPENK